MENTSLSTQNVYHIPVRLGHLRDLYEAPIFNPFDAYSEHLSGIDRITADIRRVQPKGALHATLLLPADTYSAELQPTCTSAVKRICNLRIQQIDDELTIIRRDLGRSLFLGLLIWGAGLFLGLFVYSLEGLPTFIRYFLSDGLIIAGSVGLWYPVELILYEGWDQYREKKLYERIMDIEIRVACSDEPVGGLYAQQPIPNHAQQG